jgi:DNA-directed RNA polymerase specialized sigma24 family protein
MPDSQLHDVIQYLRRIVARGDSDRISDDQLLERFVTQRDEAAFELLVWRHAKMVLGVCRRLLPDSHAAEDAFQASFLVLARRASSISKRASVGGWLYKVAYRTALEARARAIKRTRRESPLQVNFTTQARADPVMEAEQRELRCVIDEEVTVCRRSTAFRSCSAASRAEAFKKLPAISAVPWEQ